MTAETGHAALRKPRSLKVTSAAFGNGTPIPREFTGFGDDVNPPLHVSDLPKGARGLALVVDDPDAPGGVFTHWTAWDVDPDTSEIPVGSHAGVTGRNDLGSTGYRGPKPPPGRPHHYRFRVFALDARLGLAPGASVEDVWGALDHHTLGWGEVVGTFERPR